MPAQPKLEAQIDELIQATEGLLQNRAALSNGAASKAAKVIEAGGLIFCTPRDTLALPHNAAELLILMGALRHALADAQATAAPATDAPAAAAPKPKRTRKPRTAKASQPEPVATAAATSAELPHATDLGAADARSRRFKGEQVRERLRLMERRASSKQGLGSQSTKARADLEKLIELGGTADEFPAVAQALAAQSAPAPEGIDTAEAERHLNALGIGAGDPVILCAYGATNRFVPDRSDFLTPEQKQLPWEQRRDLPWNWTAATEQHQQRVSDGLGRDWQRLHRELQKAGTANMGFIGQAGGTCTKSRGGEITEMRFLTYEVDRKRDGSKPTRDEQLAALASTGLPAPTLVVDTGNVSLHVYWRLQAPVPLHEGEVARRRLFRAVEQANPDFKCDGSMASGHQPQRLAGYIHPKTGNRSTIVTANPDAIYQLAELLPLLPEIPEEELRAAEGDGQLFRDDEDKPQPGEKLALPIKDSRGRPIAVPLEAALSRRTQQLIASGQQPGAATDGGVGRCQRAYSISRTVQAAAAQLEELGQPYTGTPDELYIRFLKNSQVAEDYYNGDLDTAITRHWCETDHGEGELSKLALRRAVHSWHAHKQAKAKEERSKAHKEAAAAPEPATEGQADHHAAAKAVGASWTKEGFVPRPDTQKRWGEVKLSQTKRLDNLDRVIALVTARCRNTFRRKARIRSAAAALKVKALVQEGEMVAKIMHAQDELAGNIYQPLSAEDRKAMERPKVRWLIDDFLPEQDMTYVGGRAKVGKTRLTIAMVRSVLTGEDFLGHKNTHGPRPVVLVTDDQSDGDTADMLEQLGIWDHPLLIWSRRFRLTEKNMDALLRTLAEHPGALVVMDSLRSILRGSGIDENSPDIGPLLYDLKQPVIDAGGTFVLIHHCNKSNDAIGMEALSGHNSIAGAGNTVITLHRLENGGRIDKVSSERRLVQESRSGSGCDVVVELKPSGGWEMKESFAERLEQLSTERETLSLAKKLCAGDELHEKALELLLQRFRSGAAPAMTLMELLRLLEVCPEGVVKRSDLQAPQEKVAKKLSTFLAKLSTQNRKGEEPLVLTVPLPAEGAGGRPQKLYALTGRGADVVGEIVDS